MLHDIVLGLRALRRTRGFTLLSGLVLAIGIGTSAAMYSVLQALLLQPLPVRAPEAVVVAWAEAPARATDRLPLSYLDLREIGAEARTLSTVAGVSFYGTSEQVMVVGDGATTVGSTWVTSDFFQVLGVVPAAGRLLGPEDDARAAEPAVVIGHGLATRLFGSAEAAVGRQVEMRGRRYAVAGVAAPGLAVPRGAEVWIPALVDFPNTTDPGAEPSAIMVFDLVGRLAAGATQEQARSELDTYLAASDARRPAPLRGSGAVVASLDDVVRGDLRPVLWSATAAVALLLLIACANVANLQLVRGAGRQQEIAIRAALGASRARIVRQLVAESAVLAAAGAVAGVALAAAFVQLVRSHAPPGLPRRELVTLDASVLVGALLVMVFAVLVSGLLPALLSVRAGAAQLGSGARFVGAARETRRLRHGLVVAQVSLAVVVVIAAGLLGRSLAALNQAELGFDDDGLFIVQTILPPDAAQGRELQLDLQQEVLRRVQALPGVESVAAIPAQPFSGDGGWTAMYSAEGQGADEQARNPWVNFEVVGPEYFETMGIPIRSGRAFAAHDRTDAPRVAVVSEALARAAWPGGDALGQRIKLGGPASPGEWHEVVGVAGETRYRDLAAPMPTLYLPVLQFGGPVPMHLAVRLSAPGAVSLPRLRATLRDVHPALLVVRGASMDDLLAQPLARPRFATLVIGALGATTLLLALVGIFGALSAMVRERRRELGIRLVLGARPDGIRRLVVGQGLRLAGVGCVLGIAAAAWSTRLLQGLLWGVQAADPLTYAGVAVLVLLAAGLACLLPAVRASRVDPGIALRSEE